MTNPTTVTIDVPALREFIQENPGCDWEDACDWVEQVQGITVPDHQWGTIEEVWDEESKNWERWWGWSSGFSLWLTLKV